MRERLTLKTTDRPFHAPGQKRLSWVDHRANALPLVLADNPVVVVVPHPDDETLATGGLLQEAAHAGLPLMVVAVTDGEQSYGSDHEREMRTRRPIEQEAAIGHLAPDAPIIRLGLPDGRVAEFENLLSAIIDDITPANALIVAPWVHDHHCDHEAVGRASRAAAQQSRHRRLLASLFWTWHRTEPSRLGSERLSFLQLRPEQAQCRRAALEAHRSQLKTEDGALPVLTSAELIPMNWRREFYVS